jgi:hypothetical protein
LAVAIGRCSMIGLGQKGQGADGDWTGVLAVVRI